MRKSYFIGLLVWVLFLSGVPAIGFAQSTGTLRGAITLEGDRSPLHNVIVTIVELKRSVETDEKGVFEFQQVPPGRYTVLAHLEGFPDDVRSVTVPASGAATLDFTLRLTGPREQITVTATGSEQSTFEAFQAVTTLDTNKIAEESHPS